MSLKSKYAELRTAIDMMEGALMRCPEIIDLPEKWGEPRLRGQVGTTIISLTAKQVYDICDALAELTRIINSEEYNSENA